MTIYGRTFLIIILIFINALFAGSETALVGASEIKVEHDANKGNKRAIRTLKFMQKPTNFLSTIQVGITFIGFINGFLAAEAFTNPILNLLGEVNNINLWRAIIQISITLILTYLQVVFGELVPKKIAMKNPERFIYTFINFLNLIYFFMRPLVWILTKSADGVAALLGVSGEKDKITEEELRMVLVASQGVIDQSEREMIENVLDFDDQLTGDIMTHRTEVSAIDINISKDELINFVKEEAYTRFPVYKDSIDNIIGILHVKDLLKFIDNSNEFNLEFLLREAYLVPDSKNTNDLFKEMKRKKIHMAIVIDEYGGTAGIITMEDLIEEIVGNIFDEYDQVEVEVLQIAHNTYRIDGLANIDDVEDIIKAGLPIDDYDTVSGFVLGVLGRFPEEDEHVEFDYNGYRYEVLKYHDKVIELIKATKLEEGDKDE